MAFKLNAGEVKRSDMFKIKHDQIIIDETLRGRAFGVSSDEVEKIARSILEQGQLQPVGVRVLPEDKRVKLIYGFTRYAAIKLINETLQPGAGILVKCIATYDNEEAGFITNIVENKARNQTTSIDDAMNQKRLRTVYGWDDDRIAKQYGITRGWLKQLEALTTLDHRIQRFVATGDLDTATAMRIAKLSETKQAAIAKGMEKAKAEAVPVRQAKRELQERVRSECGIKIRSMSQVRGAWESLRCEEDDDPVGFLADAALAFFKGDLTDEAFTEIVRGIVQERVPERLRTLVPKQLVPQ